MLKEISAFFVDYNRLHEKKFKPLEENEAQAASDLVKAGQKRFEKGRRKK